MSNRDSITWRTIHHPDGTDVRFAHDGHAWLAQAPRRRLARVVVVLATLLLAAAAGLAVAL